MTLNFQDFVNEYNGKAIDDDGAYGVQCVDGFRVYCKWLGIAPYPTPNNWADGYWYDRASHSDDFDSIEDGNYRDGDVIIWARNSGSHPSSHIAMYYQGNEFGQNQGGDRSFCIKATNMHDALGGLRPKALKTTIQEEPNAVYRLYNPNSSEHFFTPSHFEAQHLADVGWDYEGLGWHSGDGDPVYRLYNPNSGVHMFTASAYERDALLNVGWEGGSTSWETVKDGSPVYRLYNPNNSLHMFTIGKQERDHLVNVGWNDEGIAFYG